MELPWTRQRIAYVHLVRGSAASTASACTAATPLRLDQEAHLRLEDGDDAEVLVFDLAP
jgi:redox-sensitive bicupin YhaK (pirin superfamily)